VGFKGGDLGGFGGYGRIFVFGDEIVAGIGMTNIISSHSRFVTRLVSG